jgi:hypothetical protein
MVIYFTVLRQEILFEILNRIKKGEHELETPDRLNLLDEMNRCD